MRPNDFYEYTITTISCMYMAIDWSHQCFPERKEWPWNKIFINSEKTLTIDISLLDSC